MFVKNKRFAHSARAAKKKRKKRDLSNWTFPLGPVCLSPFVLIPPAHSLTSLGEQGRDVNALTTFHRYLD